MMRLILALVFCASLFGSAFAQGGMGPGPGTIHSTGGGSIAFTPTDAQTLAPAFASGSFTLAIGTASADRIVIVAISAKSGGPPTTFTLNGSSMNLVGSCTTTGFDSCLFYLNVTTGTTASLAFPGGYDHISVTAGALSGQSGGGAATPSSTASYTASGAQPITLSLTVPSGGIGTIGCFGFGSAGTQVFAWTGVTNLAGDETTNDTGTAVSSAHSTSSSTVSCSSSNSLSFGGSMVAAAWAP